MVETVKRVVSFASEDPSGQFTSCAYSGGTPQKIMRSRDEMNLKAIRVAVIVGKK